MGWESIGMGSSGTRPSQARGVAAGEQQARGAPGRAAGAQAAGQLRRPHQRLRLQYRSCHHTPLEPTPPQVQVRPFKPRSPCPLSIEAPPPPAPHNQLSTVAGRGVGSTPKLPHAPPLWPCREEAPGGGLLRREAAGVAAAALSSPSRYQLRAHTGRLGGGLPWREAAGGAAAALSSPSRHQLSASPPVRWRGGALGSTPTLPHAPPLWPCRDSWGREGGSTAAWQSHCSKGEYWDGLGLSRSLAMQQRHLTGPVVAASAAGSTGAAGEGREGEGGISREAALQLPAKCFRLPGLTLACCSLLMLNYSCRFRMGFCVQVTLSGAGNPRGWDGRAAALQQLAVGATRESIGVGWPLKQHPAWTTEESLPPLIPPSLSTSQQPQHHGALHGCGRYSRWKGRVLKLVWRAIVRCAKVCVLFSVVCYIVVCYSVVCYIVVCCSLVCHGFECWVWHDMVWHAMVWHAMVWHDMVWHAMVWHAMVWHDIVRGMPWCGMTLCVSLAGGSAVGDRWEFANEGFLRGQRHLLRTIQRRKPASQTGAAATNSSLPHGHPHSPASLHGALPVPASPSLVEVGKFGLEGEVERLKRDKNVLMLELVRLRQQQQQQASTMQVMEQRVAMNEQRQQHMMTFLAKAVQNPAFLAQLMQHQTDHAKRTHAHAAMGRKKRRISKQDGGNSPPSGSSSPSLHPEGQIIAFSPAAADPSMFLLEQFFPGMTHPSSRVATGEASGAGEGSSAAGGAVSSGKARGDVVGAGAGEMAGEAGVVGGGGVGEGVGGEGIGEGIGEGDGLDLEVILVCYQRHRAVHAWHGNLLVGIDNI
ncbi:unnamed protein product, partial [Closterium sp. NIES-65]